MKSYAPLSLAAALAAAAGCQTHPNDVSFAAVRNDITPELSGLATRPDDIARNTAISANQNMRMFWDDVTRVWYIDHPSRLSPYPIRYTSGEPR